MSARVSSRDQTGALKSTVGFRNDDTERIESTDYLKAVARIGGARQEYNQTGGELTDREASRDD